MNICQFEVMDVILLFLWNGENKGGEERGKESKSGERKAEGRKGEDDERVGKMV